MKGSDFVKKINEPLGITIPDDVLAKLGEVELPDDLQAKFGEVFISRERAKHDSEIVEHITKEDRKNTFRIFDEKIKTFLPMVGTEHQNVINNTFETFKKMDILKTAMEEARKNDKGKVSEDVQKIESEWAEKMKSLRDDHAKQLQALEQKNKENQFEWIVTSKVKDYALADQFQPLKDHLVHLAITDLKNQGYHYEVENGTVAIKKEDENGVKRDVFEKGTETKLTLDKMLNTFVDPFIKKNNAEGGEPKPGKREQQQKQESPKNGGDLRDRMLADAATN
jgi:hypothetical protein